MADTPKTGGRTFLARPGRRIVITDPARRAILNPGPSKECLVTIERLERATRRPAR